MPSTTISPIVIRHTDAFEELLITAVAAGELEPATGVNKEVPASVE